MYVYIYIYIHIDIDIYTCGHSSSGGNGSRAPSVAGHPSHARPWGGAGLRAPWATTTWTELLGMIISIIIT